MVSGGVAGGRAGLGRRGKAVECFGFSLKGVVRAEEAGGAVVGVGGGTEVGGQGTEVGSRRTEVGAGVVSVGRESAGSRERGARSTSEDGSRRSEVR